MTYTIPMILMVLLAASCGGHTINSKAISPNADTIFYRMDTTITRMENQFWGMSLNFLREKKKRLRKVKCYIIVDETYDSYTGRLLRKAKKFIEKLTKSDKKALRHLHKYQPRKGDSGSYKYLVFAMIYGNKRRVLRVKSLKRNEKYKDFIIKTLLELKNELYFECVLFDRGFYDGRFVRELKKNNLPFIIRARVSKTMKKVYGFYREWRCYKDFEIGEHKCKGDLVLGIDWTSGKRTKWAFITNMEFKNWYAVRNLYRKRWNIENIFKATDGIQLKVQTNDPTVRLFCVCLSFLFYNAWQEKKKRVKITFLNFIIQLLEQFWESIEKNFKDTIEFYRDKLKIRIPFWNRIISAS